VRGVCRGICIHRGDVPLTSYNHMSAHHYRISTRAARALFSCCPHTAACRDLKANWTSSLPCQLPSMGNLNPLSLKKMANLLAESPGHCFQSCFQSIGLIWYSFMSNFTSSFTTSIAKQPTLCPTLWSASLKTHSHRVKHMVKLPKHGSLPHS
jgi:hypothetical protein